MPKTLHNINVGIYIYIYIYIYKWWGILGGKHEYTYIMTTVSCSTFSCQFKHPNNYKVAHCNIVSMSTGINVLFNIYDVEILKT